jgi:hypothetical protein
VNGPDCWTVETPHLRPDEFAAVVGEIVKLGDVPISEALAFYREHVTTMDDRK